MMSITPSQEEYMYQTIPQIFNSIAATYPDAAAQMYKDAEGNFQPITYRQLAEEVKDLASALITLGVRRGDHVGLISDNRKEWLVADLATLSLGAADVPRGSDALSHEVAFILKSVEASLCFVENEVQLAKVLALAEQLPHLKQIIVLADGGASFNQSTVKIYRYSDLIAQGKEERKTTNRDAHVLEEIESGDATELATIIFTSGTTGDPKGVMLTHANFAYQLEAIPALIQAFAPEQRWLSVLPVWHVFERILQYVILGEASTIAYSKPVASVMLADLAKVNPHFLGSVPRIWEAVRSGVFATMKREKPIVRSLFSFFVSVAHAHSWAHDRFFGKVAAFKRRSRIKDVTLSALPLLALTPLYRLGEVLVYRKITSKLGTSFIAGVSGGGSLPAGVEHFFASIGVTVVDGYGLTESAPVIGVRPVYGGVKRTMTLLDGTEAKILDEAGRAVEPGEKGTLYVRGPQVMDGYFKRPDLTALVLSEDGWLNTGDLAMWTHHGEFAIVGRAKDTIVLSGGENLEPLPIEAKLAESEYIERAVVLGQDQRFLGALIVINADRITQYLEEQRIPFLRDSISEMQEVRKLIGEEISSLINEKQGFKSYEQIVRFHLLAERFEVGKQLSAKEEVRRFAIQELYTVEIASLFAS